jgi:hypothetical protein
MWWQQCLADACARRQTNMRHLMLVQLFKKVITQDRFGDHVQEVAQLQTPFVPSITMSQRLAPARL